MKKKNAQKKEVVNKIEEEVVRPTRKPVRKAIDFEAKYKALVKLIDEEYNSALEKFNVTSELAAIKAATK